MDVDDKLLNYILEKARRRFPELIVEDFEFPVGGNYEEPERKRVVSVLQNDAFWGSVSWLKRFEAAKQVDATNKVSSRVIRNLIFKQRYGAFVPRELLVAAAHDLGFPILVEDGEVWIGIESSVSASETTGSAS